MTREFVAQGDYQEGIRWLVDVGPYGSFNAYVGIPLTSPAAGLHYDDLNASGPYVHGGWTFSGEGDDVWRPAGWYWWGWDYAHAGDWTETSWMWSTGEHRWTVEEVIAELEAVLPAFDAWLRPVARMADKLI